MEKLGKTSQDTTSGLRQSISGLSLVTPWMGLVRLGLVTGGFLGFVIIAWLTVIPIFFVGATALAGIFYSLCLVCTHDMTHRTFTGWEWFDRTLPRLISWPMVWPFGLYAELHKLHHGWNGIDLRDPERVQWTQTEYQSASGLQKWYVRHQWAIDLLFLGGIGLILKTIWHSWQLRKTLPQLTTQFWMDGIGILITQGMLLTVVLLQGAILKYLLFWIILERVTGFVMQARGHLEHDDLWGRHDNHQLTQLYASRSLTTLDWINWLLGGLPYHAVHHAFPEIPYDRLPEAHQKVQSVLRQQGLPALEMGAGYFTESVRLSRQPRLIEDGQSSKVAEVENLSN